MESRPGGASVQYDDLRGESAADIADADGNSLNSAAHALGLRAPGRVVGMSIYHQHNARNLEERSGDVSVTFQVIADDDAGHRPDDINRRIDDEGGVLTVAEYTTQLDIRDVLRHLKRLHIGLFNSKSIHAEKLEVIRRTAIEDEEAE